MTGPAPREEESNRLPGRDDPREFAALIAHQLKSPVSAAGSLLKTLLGEYAGRLSAQQKDLLSRADLRIEQALNTVQRMLAILQPQAAEGGLGAMSDAGAVVYRRQRRHLDEATKRNISFSVEVECQPAYARLGEAALSEVLDALLSNALKYTPDHGKVLIRLARPAEGDAFLTISVADSGIGIPEEFREKVFEPFFRTKVAQSTALPGTGLGLAFVKAIVDAAGGRVRVGKSELGGTEMLLELPWVDPADVAAGAETDAANRVKVVIVGGVAAGPKVASKLVRLDPGIDVMVIEKEEFLSYSGCGLPYFVSGVVEDHMDLMASSLGAERVPVFSQNARNVVVMNRTEVLEIDRSGKRVRMRRLRDGNESWVAYDKLVLATGSTPTVPPIPGARLEGVFTLHGMRDAEGIKTYLAAGKARDVVIVGGGLIGVEMTEALVTCGSRVTIVEKEPEILRILDEEMARLLERHMEGHGVRVLTGTNVLGFEGDGHVEQVVTSHGPVPADMVLLAVGVRPNVDLARRAGLELGETLALKVNERMQTSDPDIYAAGDCVESRDLVTGRPCYFPLGSTANKQGRVVAVNLCGGTETFPGVVGTCVCKVFQYCVARTGLTEAEARAAGFDVTTVLLPSLDREHFMPGARYLKLKLVVDATSRRVLGAQCLGPGHGDKRIDVVATAITNRMTIDRVANLDLSYAPPYSLAMDNLLTAANVAKNKLAGAMASVTPAEVQRKLEAKEPLVLLDVSTPREFEELRIPGSLSIPLGALRARVNELPRDRPIIAFCRISLRGYEAALILRSAGFSDVWVMDGGVEMWPYERVGGRNAVGADVLSARE